MMCGEGRRKEAETAVWYTVVRSRDENRGWIRDTKAKYSEGQTHQPETYVEILKSCPNIRSVKINLVHEDPARLNCDLEIARAIAALPRLRSLTLVSSTTSKEVLLRELCAPLRTFALWGRTKEKRVYHPAALEAFLPGVASNLEKLEIGEFAVDPEQIQTWGVASTSVFTLTQYPTVRSLSLLLYGAPLLDHLQHLFPALDGTLYFRPDPFRDNVPLAHHASVRAANQCTQECSRSQPWKKLDRIVCEPLMLYLLGLRCPVRHATLDARDISLEPYAVDALRENPVPRLKLSLRQSEL
ncbi:hypothetical protein GSI_08607 [Ganoderma sinense ZZ0214-1]|uniref:Uncharacterized protein n=1 Tax=Ganoderma sinense ZZ0214-1 TaxID=1077348 RepID=A0A2G8S459_9APHY|nr:hypothetical protein GSI_08607 [Ganoderma sinense ZZ0214-1]